MSEKSNSTIIKLTTQQQERLIDLVQSNPHLYDATLNEHRNKLVTKNTWKKIAREMNVKGLDSDQCKSKWKNIKDSFKAKRMKVKDSNRGGSASQVINTGQFYQRLQFLLEHVAEASTVSNIPAPVADTTNNPIHVDEHRAEQENDHNNANNDDDDDDVGDDDDDNNGDYDDNVCESRSAQGCELDGPSSLQNSHAHQSTIEPRKKRTLEIPTTSQPYQKKGTNKMEVLFERMNNDYMADAKKLEQIEKNSKSDISSFYMMIGEKMSKFPRQQQVWMEGQIWNMYMQLEQMQAVQNPTLSPSQSQQTCMQATYQHQ